MINSWRVIFKQDRGRSEEITWKSSEEVLVATSLPICRLLSYPVQLFKCIVRCSWLLDRIYMHLFMRKVRLTKLEFEETCQRNKLSVKRNFLGIAWYRCLYVSVETLEWYQWWRKIFSLNKKMCLLTTLCK